MMPHCSERLRPGTPGPHGPPCALERETPIVVRLGHARVERDRLLEGADRLFQSSEVRQDVAQIVVAVRIIRPD